MKHRFLGTFGFAATLAFFSSCSGDSSTTGSPAPSDSPGRGEGGASPDDESDNTGGTGGGDEKKSTGGSDGGGNSATGGDHTTAQGGAGGQGGDTSEPTICGSLQLETTQFAQPIDIIILVDNSSSMGEEIEALQNNINSNFANILDRAAVDYRVIMVTEHGPLHDESVCISPPLSGTSCSPVPAEPADNPPRFFHYDVSVQSHDALCQFLSGWSTGDANENHASGISALLREEAFKIFVPLTDDGTFCNSGELNLNDGNSVIGGEATASSFDGALLALSPTHFGTEDERKYRFDSIVGLADFDNIDPKLPWSPEEPITTAECPTGVDPGTGYQELSRMTKGLRFPICNTSGYDVVFNRIAEGAVQTNRIPCDFELPTPPDGELLALEAITASYRSEPGANQIELSQVESVNACGANDFYLDPDNQEVHLCPSTCDSIQAGTETTLDVDFPCEE